MNAFRHSVHRRRIVQACAAGDAGPAGGVGHDPAADCAGSGGEVDHDPAAKWISVRPPLKLRLYGAVLGLLVVGPGRRG
jgi:hypothetical protein